MKHILLFLVVVAVCGCTQGQRENLLSHASPIQRNIPADISTIHGCNYQSAAPIGHNEMWLTYNRAETERDMDYATRLHINQVRVFLGYTAYLKDKAAFRTNLVHFVRACHQRGIGVMVVVAYPREWSQDQTLWPLAKEYAADLVKTLGNGKEPGLAFWDVHNEPGAAAHSIRPAHGRCFP